MLLGVSDGCLFRMPSGVNGVRSSRVSAVGGVLMMAHLVMLSRFPMMPGSVCGDLMPSCDVPRPSST
jgi:hypothetical protein